jgi:UDPglucose 6-dehydrogenase
MCCNRYFLTLLISIFLLTSKTLLSQQPDIKNPQNIAILGTGYVGLVSGAGLSEIGHHVVCADVIQEKIDKLNQGIMPIYEPGIQEMVIRNIKAGRLFFSSDVAQTIHDAHIIIIAVGTPMNDNGEADLSALSEVIKVICANLTSYKVICTKSTVPIGTNKIIKARLHDILGDKAPFDIVSNPEFLREGSALQDFMTTNPIVIGSESEKALAIMEDLYKPLVDKGIALIKTDLPSAETIKYAWNCYSATKIAYVDELSRLCNTVGAHINDVIKGMSFSEKLLPIYKVKPGPGFGGSCLPKDTAALVAMCKKFGLDLSIIPAVRKANEIHRKEILKDFYALLDNAVTGKKIAVLGLSFKANTDDIRYSPAIDMIQTLLKDGAQVYAYDPQAMTNMHKIISDIHYCTSTEEALAQADALLLLTDWDEFKDLDLTHVATLMAHRILFDTRNIFEPSQLAKLNFTFKNLGYNY